MGYIEMIMTDALTITEIEMRLKHLNQLLRHYTYRNIRDNTEIIEAVRWGIEHNQNKLKEFTHK